MPQIRREDVRDPVIRLAGRQVTPVARVTRVAWQGGALEWYHPLAVEIADNEASQPNLPTQRIPIHDATRRAMLGMLLAALLVAAALEGVTGWVRQRQRASGRQQTRRYQR